MKQKTEYISLKEASEISGYSPDYIGQLIRRGKLPGKQVFQQVVWMTTEADIRRYIEEKRPAKEPGKQAARSPKSLVRFLQSIDPQRITVPFLYLAAGLSVCLFLLIFYVFTSSLDHNLDQRAEQQAQVKGTP